MVRIGVDSDLSEATQPFPDDAPAPNGGSATVPEDHSTAVMSRLAAGAAPLDERRRLGLTWLGGVAAWLPVAGIVRRWDRAEGWAGS
jgi:hypothetical protein